MLNNFFDYTKRSHLLALEIEFWFKNGRLGGHDFRVDYEGLRVCVCDGFYGGDNIRLDGSQQECDLRGRKS